MSVQRLVRIGVAGVFFVLLGTAEQAATAAGDTMAIQAELKAAADNKQATALISPRFGEVVRPVSGARPPEATDSPLGGQRAWGLESNDLARTQIAAARAAGAARAGSRQDAPARADDEAADMADLEIVALIGALLIAVLSLSRRRNL